MDKVAEHPIIPPVQGGDIPTVVKSVQGVSVLFNRLYAALSLRLNAAITADGVDGMTDPLKLAADATADLPAAADWQYGVQYDTDVGTPVFSDGSSWIGLNKGGLIGIQNFTTAGTATYTPTTGTRYVVVEVIGGGGGSGGIAATGAGQVSSGGSGGGGGYARKLITSSFSGVTVTVGAAGTAGSAGNNAGGTGGTSSFGSLVSATGGSGGQGGGAASPPQFLNGSIGGAGSNGDINGFGTPSQCMINTTSSLMAQASAGGSVYCGGRAGTVTGSTRAAGPGLGAGSGALGPVNCASQSAAAGAAGGAGAVIVWEYA